MYDDIFNKMIIPAEDKKMTQDLFDLALERVIKKLYLTLGEDSRKKMAEVFLSQDPKLQEEFITTYLLNLENVFRQEIEILRKEIKADLKK